jgi:hypothetical protein
MDWQRFRIGLLFETINKYKNIKLSACARVRVDIRHQSQFPVRDARGKMALERLFETNQRRLLCKSCSQTPRKKNEAYKDTGKASSRDEHTPLVKNSTSQKKHTMRGNKRRAAAGWTKGCTCRAAGRRTIPTNRQRSSTERVLATPQTQSCESGAVPK